MTTASPRSGAAGQYCEPAPASPARADAAHNESECPLTLLLFSSLHTDGPLFDEADPEIGLQPV